MSNIKLLKKSVLVVFFVIVFYGVSFSGILHRVSTGDTLGENNLKIITGYERIDYLGNYLNFFPLKLGYGVGRTVDFFLTFPLLSLGGISDSLIIGDLGFELNIRIFEAPYKEEYFFIMLGFKVGISVEEGEGKLNPSTGSFQTYFPFAKGKSEMYIGAGYTRPLGRFMLHLNFIYFNEARGSEEVFNVNVKNDYIRLGGAVDYYISTRIFKGRVNLAFRPFAELLFLFNWSSESSMPTRLDTTIGFWARIGSVFRIKLGVNFPLKLDSNRFLEREVFLEFAFMFK